MSSEKIELPPGFIWATATSAFQIEGAANEDGRGPSIWDAYTRLPSKIRDNSTSDIACHSYHLYKTDIENLKWLGVKQYRFSISWSRIMPNGQPDSINTAGVNYYHKLIDSLLEENILPQVTLYHWDLPLSLGDLGGWLNRQIVDWFAEYARFCFQEYGDKVKSWITLNEPRSQSLYGYCGDYYEQAPGDFKAHGAWTMYLAGHHMLLAHARAFRIYETEFMETQKGEVGIALSVSGYEPHDPDSDSDCEAAKRDFQFSFGWFANPIFSETGDYPAVMKKRIAKLSTIEKRTTSRLPAFSSAELVELIGSAHFLGLNYYTSRTSRERKEGDAPPIGQIFYDTGTVHARRDEWKWSENINVNSVRLTKVLVHVVP